MGSAGSHVSLSGRTGKVEENVGKREKGDRERESARGSVGIHTRIHVGVYVWGKVREREKIG